MATNDVRVSLSLLQLHLSAGLGAYEPCDGAEVVVVRPDENPEERGFSPAPLHCFRLAGQLHLHRSLTSRVAFWKHKIVLFEEKKLKHNLYLMSTAFSCSPHLRFRSYRSCWCCRPSCIRRCPSRRLCCLHGRCLCLWLQRKWLGCWVGCCCSAVVRGDGSPCAWRASWPAPQPHLPDTPALCRPVQMSRARHVMYPQERIDSETMPHLHQVHVAVDTTGLTVLQDLHVLALVCVWSCMESWRKTVCFELDVVMLRRCLKHYLTRRLHVSNLICVRGISSACDCVY